MIEYITSTPSGAANVTLGGDSTLFTQIESVINVLTINVATIDSACNLGVRNGGSVQSVVLTGAPLAPDILYGFAGFDSSFNFGTSLDAALLTFTNCAQIPTMPNGCVSVTASGAVTSTTLTSGTTVPVTINISAVTGGTLTTLNFAAAVANSGGGAVSHILTGQAFASVDTYLVNMVTALADVTSGTINLSGGTNAAPTIPNVVVSGAGTTAVNGTYTKRGTNDGKPYYNLVGQPNNILLHSLYWSTANMEWFLVGNVSDNAAYGSADDVPYPSSATFVTLDFGTEPPPSVTGGGPNAARATLEGQGITVTTN